MVQFTDLEEAVIVSLDRDAEYNDGDSITEASRGKDSVSKRYKGAKTLAKTHTIRQRDRS
jgi:hypothetical protein